MGILIDRIARQRERQAQCEYHDRIREAEARARRNGYRDAYCDDDGYWFPASARDNLLFAGMLLGVAAAWVGIAMAIIWFPASARDNLLFAGMLLGGAAAWVGIAMAIIWFWWR